MDAQRQEADAAEDRNELSNVRLAEVFARRSESVARAADSAIRGARYRWRHLSENVIKWCTFKALSLHDMVGPGILTQLVQGGPALVEG